MLLKGRIADICAPYHGQANAVEKSHSGEFQEEARKMDKRLAHFITMVVIMAIMVEAKLGQGTGIYRKNFIGDTSIFTVTVVVAFIDQ